MTTKEMIRRARGMITYLQRHEGNYFPAMHQDGDEEFFVAIIKSLQHYEELKEEEYHRGIEKDLNT